jgi:8-hydroxy-5-deazaflavin:NADPH oxidoreductase
MRGAIVSRMAVGIVGGTGPLGAGLGLRLAVAGTRVVIGSRDAARATEVVNGHLDSWPGRNLPVTGAENRGAAGCDVVVIATPWEAVVQTVTPLTDELAGTVVISVGNALMKQGREFVAINPPRGSVAAMLQSTLPRSRVVAACHHLPASSLLDLEAPLDSDVLVCSDFPDATDVAVELLQTIDGIRALVAGSLVQATSIEALTAVLVNLNVRYKTHATIKIGGL